MGSDKSACGGVGGRSIAIDNVVTPLEVIMVALFCNTRRMELDPLLGSIAEHKANIVPVLTSSAFTNVINNESEIAGNRAGMRLSILHLHIGGRSFYQQVMAAGNDGAATKSLVDEIVRSISF